MDLYKLAFITLLSSVVVTNSRCHHPQVREVSLEASSPHHSKVATLYHGPVFEYGKTAQPDMQKWRYYQQQQVNAKHFAKFKDQLHPLYPKKINVEIQRNGWVPKVISSKTMDPLPKIPQINKRRDYKLQDQDLQTQSSETYNQHSEFRPSPQFITGHAVYNQNNHNVAQLDSLLAQPPSNQINGLQKLLLSQSEYAPHNNIQSQQPLQSQQSGATQSAVHPQNIFKNTPTIANPQQIDHLQSELDLISNDHVQKLLQEAQQQAFNQVKLQHDALEKVKVEAEKAAMAKIQALNSGAVDTSLQTSSNTIDEKPATSNAEQLPLPQPLITSAPDHNAAIQRAVLQAQTYLQQSVQNHLLQPTLKEIKAIQVNPSQQSIPADNKPSYSYPQNNIILDNNNINTKESEAISNEVTLKELEEDDAEETQNEDYTDEYAPNYKFGYQIMDYHSGNDFGHEETKEGKMTKGQYHILLPDGRTQNVEYWADSSGYHAKVTYSNVAQH